MNIGVSLNDYGGFDAMELYRSCVENELPTDWFAEANRYTSPVGFCPGRGGALITRSRLDKIDLTGKLKMVLADGIGGQILFPNLRAVGNPRCIDAGTNDPVYLVYLSDARIDVIGTTSRRYQWRFHPTDDIPFVGTDGVTGLADAIEELWGMAPNILGDFPGLPDEVPTPTTAAIDRLDLHGFRLADAIEDLLAALGCAVAFDVTAETDPWSIVYFPNSEDKAETIQRKYRGLLNHDESPYSPAQFGFIPYSVSVVFPIWIASRYGRIPRKVWIEPVARPSLTWAKGGRIYPGTVAYLQDYMTARVNANFEVQNQSALTARAAQVSRIFYDRMASTAPQWPIKQLYTGVIKDTLLVPGGSFDAIGWQVAERNPTTFIVRSGLAAQTELYADESLIGVRTDWNPEPLTLNGVVLRTGGVAPGPDREQDIWGRTSPKTGSVSIAGAGVGPYFKRASALRQGEWASAGTGGKTDQRGRLWRNWEDFGPDDMDRFISAGSFNDEFQLYECRVLRQEGRIPWPREEAAWAEGANDEELVPGWVYRARAGTDIVDGKLVWATACCNGSEGGVGGPTPDPSAACCPEATPLPAALYTTLSGTCLGCFPLSLSMIKNATTGKHTGSTTCSVGSCTYTYEASLQCYPCAQPPLDSACVDLNCSTEDYYYCYSWSLTPSGTGCEYPAQSGTIAIPASEVNCSDFEFDGTHSIVNSSGVPCTVTVHTGTSFVGPPCEGQSFASASCVMSNKFGYLALETDPFVQTSGGMDVASWSTLPGNATIANVELQCDPGFGTVTGLYVIRALFGYSGCMPPGVSVQMTLATVSYSVSPFIWVLDATIPGWKFNSPPNGPCAETNSGCRLTITIP